MIVCPACGSENREGARFCDACGSQLEAAPSRGGFRRTVTVLFSDITGSTELGRDLDPELLRGILAGYYDAMRALMERHGGTVEKFIGDAVMAVFGIPRIHEDDALRAVRAASETPETLASLNDEIERQHGVRIRSRTGVATGEVMVGEAETAETLVTGMPTNIAARLEQAAQPDAVLIGEETYRLVRDAVLAEAVEPLSLKGVGDAVPAYRVLKVDPGAAGFARRLDAPMVGRNRELALLRDAFDRAVSDGSCQLFTVLGIGGVGKSRLLAAFLERLPEDVIALRGRCLPYGDGITFTPVVEAVGQAAALNGAEDPDEALAKIVEVLSDDEHAEHIGRQLAQLLGLESGEAAPEETLWAIRRFLEALGRRQPVAFVIDDLQWAEQTMLDLVEYLADWVVETPLLLACMARPELLDLRPSWGGGKLNATSISLEPLTPSECEDLVTNLLAIDSVDPAVRERVAFVAEGHPLFAEEMLAMLVDDGRVVRRGSSWVAAGDLGDLTVPPTTSALLAARIDRLSPEERAVLGRASVMGQVFYREALDRLADEDPAAYLASLVRKQFIRPERTDLPGVDAMAFRHLMIRDAAYEVSPKALRAELHERFADWLEDRAPEQDEAIGFHLERACTYLLEVGGDADRSIRLAEAAAAHLRAAGDRAYERFDIPATIALLTRATELMTPADPGLAHASIELAVALIESGEFERGDAALERAISIGESRDDEGLAARARSIRLYMSFWGPAPTTAADASEGARRELEIAERTGDELGAAWALALLGGVSWGLTRAAEARPAFRRAVDLFRTSGDRRMVEETLSWLASVPAWGPTSCDEALREIESYAGELSVSLAAGTEIAAAASTPLWMKGDFDEARRICQIAHERRRELGRVVQDAHSSQSIGWVELMAGNVVEAERILREGAGELMEMGSMFSGKLISNMHAYALYVLQRFDEAHEVATSVAAQPGEQDTSGAAISLSVRGMVAARRGRFEEGERFACDAIELLDEGDFINDQADARIALAEVLELAGRTDDAADAVRDALDRYRRKGNITQTATAEVRLARLVS